MHWKTWLEAERLADLRPAGSLTFSGYDQIIPAAVAGHGVALGRDPLVRKLLTAGDLVAPFKRSADPARGYFAIVSKHAEGRPEVANFVAWLKEEAKKEPR
jgi:DNA-binding transcriptional LysR family regulator